MQLLQKDILEMIARGDTLESTATALCVRIEAILPQVICSIASVDSRACLKIVAAPGLPEIYRCAFDGLPISRQVGACCSAIFLGESVECTDIETDLRWADFAYLPLAIGLHACRSTPVIDRNGGVLGAVTFYYRVPPRQTREEAEIIEATIDLCATAMERKQKQSESLQELWLDDHLSNAGVSGPGAEEQVFRYAILLCGENWRVVSKRRQFGHFSSRSAALQCAIGLAREAMASGASVELLQADIGGELQAFRLPGGRTLAA